MNKPLPSDKKMENIVLGTLIQFPAKIDKVMGYFTDSNVLFQDKAKRLWEILLGMRNRGEHIDLMTVNSHLSDEDKNRGVNDGYLAECTINTTLSDTAEVYAKRLYEKYLLRRVIFQTKKIEINAMDSKDETYDTLIAAHTSLGELISIRPDTKFNIEEEIIDAVNSITSKEKKLIQTNYQAIDRFAGGLTRGEITIVGGRPGHGKSTFLLNVLSNLLSQERRVLLFNRELTNIEVLKKLIAIESGQLSYSLIRKGIYDDTSIKELERTKKLITNKYNEENFAMFDAIKDFSKSAVEIKKFKPDVIIDDYIQLITPSGKEEQRRLQLERLVNDYKWIAKEHQCAVILASQLNRGIESRDKAIPRLSDLAESGAIEQVAENVFFLYYGHKVKPNPAKKNMITLHAAKVRYGETGQSEMGYDGDKSKMFDSHEEFLESQREPIQKEEDDETLPF